MRYRLLTREESLERYGDGYARIMNFNEEGLMDCLYGKELSKEETQSFLDTLRRDHDGLFRVHSNTGHIGSWTIRNIDVTLVSRDIYIQDESFFIEMYGEDYLNDTNCIIVHGMVKELGRKLEDTEVDWLISSLSSIDNTITLGDWSYLKDWLTDKPKAKVLSHKKEASIHLSVLTVLRGNVQISIERKHEEEDVIYFVDGEDSSSYEIEKKNLVEPKEGCTYIMKAKNIVNEKVAIMSLYTVFEHKGSYEGLEFFKSRGTIESKSLDKLLSALYSIKNIEEEYREALVSKFIINNYPDLNVKDLEKITDGLKGIEKLTEIFQVEA